MAALTTGVTVLDYVAPAVGVKKYGGSKFAVWASITGLIVGVFFFPPWGMIIGAFLGALAGEAVFGEKGKPVMRVVWGVFAGTLAGTGLKLAVSGVILFFYIKEMF